MRVRSIDHVQLAMPAGEEERARGFYSGALRLPEVPKPPHLAARGGCWFESDTVKIHLGVDPEFRPARKAHPALLVEDLQKLVGRLRAGGYALVDDDPLEGYQRIYVYDPFGNRLELMEPHAKRGSRVGPRTAAGRRSRRTADRRPGRRAKSNG
jgi:catechol 2,3-dioxygenase-like lactoylglutathione lyase family enzyme